MSWPIHSLAEVAPINARKPELFDGTRRYYSTGAVGKNGELDTPELVTFAERPSRANCMPKIGDVGLARMNGTQKVVLVSEAELGSLFSTGFCFLEPNDALDSKYLFYFLTSEGFQSEKNVLAGEGIMGGIKNSDVANIQIPLPPLLEQRRIVRLLDEAFEGITIAKANAEKNLQNAHELLSSHTQALFGQVDNEWREVQLEKLCTVDWGNTKLTKSAYVEGGEYLAVSAAGCDGRIGHKEHAKFTPVLSAIGAQCGRMFLPDEDFTAIKNTITLTPKDGTCTGKFLYRLLTYVELPKRGAAQPFISKGDIQTFSVNVPPLTTQEWVVELLDKLEKHTAGLAQVYGNKLAKLDALKHSLLQRAFTGDFKVLS
jgi:type I restriction enzyme S subunit